MAWITVCRESFILCQAVLSIVTWGRQRAGIASRNTEALFKALTVFSFVCFVVVVANTLLTKARLLLSPESEREGLTELHAKNVDARREEELGLLMQSTEG